MKIFFSVGEPSGDLHGANLIRELQSRAGGQVRCVGFGGPKMRAAGCELTEDLTKLAVMGFLEVFWKLPQFFRLKRVAEEYFKRQKPDAVVLIDFPGFNWHIARLAKQHGVPVFYYGAPQLWAWASWRVKKMRRDVDHALCKLPFEEDWLRERGVNATYVGHPYFDELSQRVLDEGFIDQQRRNQRPLVTLLPGSRTQEVRNNLHWQLSAAKKIHQRVPESRFAIASFKASQAEMAKAAIRKAGMQSDFPIEVHVGRTGELIEAATCCLAVSGSVSLELLYHAKPTVILYHVSRFAHWMQGYFRRVRYITLVNLLTAESPFCDDAGFYDRCDPQDAHVLMPEYLTCEDRSDQLAEHAVEWLTDAESRESLQEAMRSLTDRIGRGGASQRAAQYIWSELSSTERHLGAA